MSFLLFHTIREQEGHWYKWDGEDIGKECQRVKSAYTVYTYKLVEK
jgi:hypothetical protein